MVQKTWFQKFFILLAVVGCISVGCQGSETKKAAEEIRDEVTGNRAVKQGQKMKEDIKDIEKQSAETNENLKKQTGDSE